MKTNRTILFALASVATLPAWADQTVRGTITQASTNLPLAGVYVQSFTDQSRSTMTDSEGHFEIVLPDQCRSLRVRCDGYQSQQVAIQGRTEGVDTQLYPASFTGEVGLAETSVLSLSAPVSTLNADVSIDTQIASELGGQLRSVSRGGVPGMGAYMLLDGISSLSANAQPLVVIDGIIQDMQYSRTTLHDGAYSNLLAALSVQDIESVEVLRSGTAIYGAKGANGVILINTRRGHSLNTKIDFSAATTFGMEPRLPQMMNASEYRTYVSEMLGSTDTKLTDFKFLRDDPNYYYYRVYHNETDWSDQVYQNSKSQTYNLNVQGGDDVAVYNLSIGYTTADAAVKYNDFSRFNMRINSDVHLNDRLSVQLDASYSDINRDLRDDGVPESLTSGVITSPTFLSLVKSPFLSPYSYDTQGNLSHFLAGADDYLDEVIGTDASLANPASILHYGEAENKNKFDNRLVTLGITPKFNIGHGLSLIDRFNFTMFNMEENYYLPVTGVPTYRVEGVGYVSNLVESQSSHEYLTSNDLRINWLYNKDGHKLDLTGGWRFSMASYQLNGMKGYESGNDKLPNMNTSLSYRSTFGDNESVTTLTYYVNGDYNWQGRIYANVGASVEASSRFGADAGHFRLFGVPWGIFPSASASWVLSNEDWFRAPGIDYMRVSLGYDMTGNDDLDLKASKTYFRAINLFNRIDGYEVGNIGNTDLTWETTHRLHLGLDMNLLNNRLSLSLSAYKSKTNHLVTKQALPYVIGLSENWCNGGSLSNVGATLDLRAKLINMKNFQWQMGLSVGAYKNKIESLSYGSIYTDYCGAQILTQEGQSAGVFYGFKTDGVFSTTADAEAAGLYITDRTGARTYFQAGDMRFVDNGDHEINDADRTIIGDPNPDLYGTYTNRLQYRNLSLDVVMSYQLGGDIYNYQRSILESGSQFYNATTAMRGRWSSEGQNTTIPRLQYQDPMGNARFSDRWIEDGSYLRIKNIVLSYKWDFDYRFLQGITIWGSANNLYTFTRYLGSDPEVSASNGVLFQGIDRGILPASRSFSLGIKVNL